MGEGVFGRRAQRPGCFDGVPAVGNRESQVSIDHFFAALNTLVK